MNNLLGIELCDRITWQIYIECSFPQIIHLTGSYFIFNLLKFILKFTLNFNRSILISVLLSNWYQLKTRTCLQKIAKKKRLSSTSKECNRIEMEPLHTSRRVLTCLCICSFDKTTSMKEKSIYITLSVSIIFAEIFMLIASVVFFMKNVSTNLEESLFALLQIAGLVGSLYIMATAYISQHKIMSIFDSLSQIYTSSMYFWTDFGICIFQYQACLVFKVILSRRSNFVCMYYDKI